MKDKASQKTEDEVLDQTFGGDQTFDGFDEEMTAQTQDETKTGSSAPAKKKASGSNNTLLFVVGGVAAVGILGYMFVLKPMLNPTQAPAKPAQQQAVVPDQAPVTPPVTANVPVATTATPERQVATDYLLNGNAPAPGAAPVVPPVTPVVPVVPQVTASAPVVVPSVVPTLPVIPEVTKVPEVSSSNAPSAAIVEELGRKFDTQGQQFRIALDDVGSKVTNLEKFRDEQLGVNKNVDERLTKLEGGKVVKTVKTPAKAVVTETASAPVVKKAPSKSSRYIKEVKEPREPREYRNVLVDKTEDRDIKGRDSKVKEPGVEYNIHSIYGGRIWLKNSDGSLSTYTSGDRLPSGELIKSVDDEKYLVNTDKRSFSKK
jgi:hypothetical protein